MSKHTPGPFVWKRYRSPTGAGYSYRCLGSVRALSGGRVTVIVMRDSEKKDQWLAGNTWTIMSNFRTARAAKEMAEKHY